MEIVGIGWAGVRANDFDALVAFFADQVGLSLARRMDKTGLAHFKFPSGELFEVYAPHHPDAELHSRPVIGFQVDDLKAARAEMEANGVEFVTEIDSWKGDSWCYFKSPDGHLYQLFEKAARVEEE